MPKGDRPNTDRMEKLTPYPTEKSTRDPLRMQTQERSSDASSSLQKPSESRDLDAEKVDLIKGLTNTPHTLDQIRETNQKWLDSLPNKVDKDKGAKDLLNEEYSVLIYNTMSANSMSINQIRETNQKWLGSLPPEYRDEWTKIVLNTEVKNMIYRSKDMPNEQKVQQRQRWHENVPQEYKKEMARIISEAQR